MIAKTVMSESQLELHKFSEADEEDFSDMFEGHDQKETLGRLIIRRHRALCA